MNLVESVNMFRQLDGFHVLMEDQELCILAFKHVKFMARRNWIHAFNIKETNLIAVGNNEDAVIRQWVNQPDTRKIMFDKWIKIGSASFKSKKDIIYWCCLFK